MSTKGGRVGTAMLLALCLLAMLSSAGAGSLRSSPLSSGGARDGMLKVRLDSLGQFQRLDITTQGSYSLAGEVELDLPPGSRLSFFCSPSEGGITLSCRGQSYSLGSAFQLRRHQSSDTAGIRLAQARNPGNLYPADLYVFGTATEGSTGYTAIINVFLEDYLYGVLPYEMGEGAHPEALKAQAVAARTYAMARMGNRLYHVVDTTRDQVYAGTPAGNPNAKAAVDATRGIVVQNAGVLTATYYTASNGGQTESIKNLWNSEGYPYLDVRNDPYDLANPASRVKSVEFFFNPEHLDETLYELLISKARQVTGDDAVRLERILSLLPHTPKYPSPSRLYTRLDVAVNLLTGEGTERYILTFDIFRELEGALGLSINSQQNELYSVSRTETGFVLSARRYGHGLGMSQRGAMHMGGMGYTYDQILAFYYPGCVRVGYTLGRSILSAFVPGHMSSPLPSQETPAPIAPLNPAYAETIAPCVMCRQPVAGAPVLLHLPAGSRVQVVCEDADYYGVRFGQLEGYVFKSRIAFGGTAPDGVLSPGKLLGYGVIIGAGAVNLRAGPSLSHRVLMSLPRGTLLPLFEQEGNFYQVQYGTQLGYVSKDFLDRQDTHPYQALMNGPEEAIIRGSDVPFRSQPGSSSPIIKRLQDGDKVTLLRLEDSWAYVQQEERFGYLPANRLEYLRLPRTGILEEEEPPAPTPAPDHDILYAWVSTPSGSLNFRTAPSLNAGIRFTLQPGTRVKVLEGGGEWTGIEARGIKGYVMSRFLRFKEEERSAPATSAAPVTSPSVAPTTKPTAAPTTTPFVLGKAAWVNTSSGWLNLRKDADPEGAVIARIPHGDQVLALSALDGWTKVTYEGRTGYVVSVFLGFTKPEANRPASSNRPAGLSQSPDSFRDPGLRLLAQPRDARAKPEKRAAALRAGCHEESTLLAMIRPGDALLVVEEGQTWCKIQYEGKEGYCLKEALEIYSW